MYSSNDIDYSVHRRLRYDYDKDSEEYTEVLPIDAVPIEIKETPHTWIRPSQIVPQDILPNETEVINTVTDLLDTLHPWERMLLLETSFLQPEVDVWQQLCTGQCFAASDGSAPHGKGSFAWVLSDTTGRRLARCHGPVFGHAISSYRAEGYGMLSFLRFLFHMVRLHGHSEAPIIPPHLVCDNKSLIETVSKVMTYPHIYPNTTMDAEWDCIAQIVTTMKTFDDRTPTIDHVKGHQDDRTPYEELPLSAQLNCDADSYANLYIQRNPDIHHGTVLQFPAPAAPIRNHHTRHQICMQQCTESSCIPSTHHQEEPMV